MVAKELEVEPPCPARYHLNRGVKCWVVAPHVQHEGLYFLAGQVVTWTDEDKAPEQSEPEPEPPRPTAIEEAFRRAEDLRKGKKP